MEKKKVNSILKKIDIDFIKKKAKKTTKKDFEKVVRIAKEIIEKAKKIPVLGRYVDVIEIMISLVKDYSNGTYRSIPYWSISAIVFSLLYFFNPVDLIPDAIPVIGYLDDVLVFDLCLRLVENDLENYKIFKENN